MDKFKRGQAPYGFRWLGGRLMVEELEAAIRRRAVEEFLKLKSMGAVARHLNDAGFETRRGGKWTDVQIARILECSSAIGTYEINRSEEDGSGQRRKTGKGERATVECEPIVTREVWEKVQALIQGKRAKRTEGEDEKAPLSGLVWCGCGQKMRMAEGADKFVCPKCSTQISAEDLEAIFADDFAEVVGSHPSLLGALEAPSERREWMRQMVEVQNELADAVGQRAGVERMFTEKSISKVRFEELHVPLEKRVRELEGKLASLRRKLETAASEPEGKPWATLWESWPRDRPRRIMFTFVGGFVVAGDEVEIAYLLPEPSGSKETDKPQQITSPTNQPTTGGPVYIRLPKPGTRCLYSGLSRSKLNELVLSCERNNFNPPVASKSLRKKGSTKGVRLVLLESLMAHLSGSA